MSLDGIKMSSSSVIFGSRSRSSSALSYSRSISFVVVRFYKARIRFISRSDVVISILS